MRKHSLVVSLLLLTQVCSGCAVVTVLNHPDKKNLGILNRGMARENVIAYLGAPISSEEAGGKKTDIYQFVQGYSGANKAARASFHAILDLGTIFIWELIAWPAETILKSEKMSVKVAYDQSNRIEDFSILRVGKGTS